jgi:hypothetical protein
MPGRHRGLSDRPRAVFDALATRCYLHLNAAQNQHRQGRYRVRFEVEKTDAESARALYLLTYLCRRTYSQQLHSTHAVADRWARSYQHTPGRNRGRPQVSKVNQFRRWRSGWHRPRARFGGDSNGGAERSIGHQGHRHRTGLHRSLRDRAHVHPAFADIEIDGEERTAIACWLSREICTAASCR